MRLLRHLLAHARRPRVSLHVLAQASPQLDYDPLVVGFNSQYLIDFLKAIGNTGEVRLEFKDAQSAGQMRPEDGNDEVKYRYILMPMRI